jgi:tRNA modification GTPase
MSALAALLTPRGPGAIATVKLSGPLAAVILARIFDPAQSIPPVGNLSLGRIVDSTEIIDQVILACEADDSFAINCHGSPLVVEILMNLLSRHGAELVEPKSYLYRQLRRDKSLSAIAVEAAVEQTDSLTIEGTKLISNQLTAGLVPLALRWSSLLSADSLPAIKAEATGVLNRSGTAQLIIRGARIVLAGPPNSGKSTLLNAMAGRATSIVADEPGTTRDYVSARFTIPSLAVEVIDTAGMDASGCTRGDIDATAQQRSRQLVASADLVVLVLDSTKPASQFDASLLAGCRVVTACNKCDLARLDIVGAVAISASLGQNIPSLIEAIRIALGVIGFDLAAPAAFTARQHGILTGLTGADGEAATRGLITELLNGRLAV